MEEFIHKSAKLTSAFVTPKGITKNSEAPYIVTHDVLASSLVALHT